MSSKKTDLLTLGGEMLEEINQQLEPKLESLPPEVKALLAQKGAVTQVVLRELMHLIDESAARNAEYNALIRACRHWRDDFFIPLRDQSDGKPMAKSIYLTDLVKMIEDLDRVISHEEA